MNRDQVVKALNTQVLEDFNFAFLKFFRDTNASEYELDRTTKTTIRNVSGLTYNKRDNYFSNARGTCGFNPETFDGHSYRWWVMTRRIKGKVVLNSYRYSQQTAIHIKRTREVLRDLGIQFIEVPSPQGLQNLDSALDYAYNIQARGYISAKYSRTKTTDARLAKMINVKGPMFKVLSSIGVKASLNDLKLKIATLEASRLVELQRAREKRLELKAMAKVEFISDRLGVQCDGDGMHLFKPQTYYWNDNDYIDSIYTMQNYRQIAVRQGFTKIYVHGINHPAEADAE